jgi:hypothetical protein
MVMKGLDSTGRKTTERKKTLRNHETNTLSNSIGTCLLFHDMMR